MMLKFMLLMMMVVVCCCWLVGDNDCCWLMMIMIVVGDDGCWLSMMVGCWLQFVCVVPLRVRGHAQKAPQCRFLENPHFFSSFGLLSFSLPLSPTPFS